MQRRAAAIYFAFFVIVGAGAYGLIATTSAPAVSLDAQSYAEGDDVQLNDRTFTLSSTGDGTGELSWVNDSAVLTETLDNGSEVPPTAVVWEDQQARTEATLDDGSTVAFNGSEYAVSVDGSAGSLTLTNVDDEADNETFETGDTLNYQGNDATVTSVGSDSATLVWGDPYVVNVHNESVADPTEASLVQQRNVTALATADPALYNDTVVQNGVRQVTYRANDTNVPVSDYLDPVETHTIEEGGTLDYEGNESTVDEITNTTVELTRPGQTTETIDLSEGGNVTVDGEQYFAHFPDNSSVQILPTDERYGEYDSQNEEISSYNERMAGLWGIAEISAIAAIILLATAYLPVRG